MTSSTECAPARRRRYGAPKNWRQTFLAKLADTSNVSAAADSAQISLSWAYKTRREDPQFSRQWFTALCEGYDNLEMDLLHRLRSGEAKDAEPRKFDNATAFRLLAIHRQTVAREKALQENDDEAAILASIDAKLDAMRERAQLNASAGDLDDE
ncbi:MAG: hypothetical protein KDE25_01790 [Novosphingobium sp.]|nr:hypothetical protein [Novosphingobium sp.]